MKIYTQDRYRLRALSATDWLPYKDMRLKAIRTEPEVFAGNFEREMKYTPQQWKAILSDPERVYFGLYSDDVLIGLTGLMVDPWDQQRCVFISSYITPSQRQKGLSSLFYIGRLDWAYQNKMKHVIVSHRGSNKASKAANQKFGFIQTHRAPRIWPDGVEADEVFYRLEL